MSLGSWDPDADSAAHHLQIEPTTLSRFIGYSREEQLSQLEQLISGDENQVLAGLMQIDHSAWLAAIESLPEEDLLHLIRFFAVAENLPGWEAGPKSPVIPLAKTLRKRGVRLDKALLHWLREVNDNRFLPYGPL
jgi:hypothetical protein